MTPSLLVQAFEIAKVTSGATEYVLLPNLLSATDTRHNEAIFCVPDTGTPPAATSIVRVDPPLPRFDCDSPPRPYFERYVGAHTSACDAPPPVHDVFASYLGECLS